MSRPRVYDRKKTLEKLCLLMAEGRRTLEQICEQEPDMPCRQDIYVWCAESDELTDIFMRAKRLWCMAQADEMIKIADDDSRDIMDTEDSYCDAKGNVTTKARRTSDNTPVNRDKLRIQTRQWSMQRFHPNLFGDKITQEVTGKDGKDFTPVLNITIEKKGE